MAKSDNGDDAYEAELAELQLALVRYQQHAMKAGDKVLVIFEGRDAAGKDGAISRITEHMSIRATRVVALPKPTDPEYGAYLINAAACRECHTKMEKGKAVGEPFAGGFEFQFPNGAVARSANITPDTLTGIGAWDRATFIRKFRQFTDSSYVPAAVDWRTGDIQTVMPWTMYGGMSEQDLGAIYDHLRTLAPVRNKVQYWSPAGK